VRPTAELVDSATAGGASGDNRRVDMTKPAATIARPPRATDTPTDRGGERRREVATYWAYRLGERVLDALPRRFLMVAASAAGNVAYDLAGSKRSLLHENLAHAMGRSPDDRRVRSAARRAFRNYAKYLVDMMRMAGMTQRDVDRLVRIDNVECLAEARASGGGILICTVHVGGMDLIAPALSSVGEKLHVVADDTTYGRLYEHLKRVRARHGLFLIGWRNLRGLFRVLRDGENLVLFCDGGYRRGDVPVEFLGEPTTFPIGPASLSARTHTPMLPVHCSRTPSETFVARGLPVIRAAEDSPAEIYRATQALADALGAVIARDPGQWYMFRPVWPQTDADRQAASATLEAARRGDDWARL
jgi:lauroyl/myristoyl acyltransferase